VEDRAAQGRVRVGFRRPLTSVLPVLALMSLWALLRPSEDKWAFVLVFTALYAVIRMRQLLVLTDEHLEVTVFRTRRIPRAQVQGFESGSRFQGGTRIQTSSGVVNSYSPCSWWGGPADEADIETLRREARARR
jgi:hypothetical protein